MGKTATARIADDQPKATAAPKKPAGPTKAEQAEAAKKLTELAELEEGVDNDANMHQIHDDINEAMSHFSDDDDLHGDSESWKPPGELDAPAPREGFVQRWVRSSLVGKVDGKNLAASSRQGWRPRSFDTVPEGQRRRYPSVKTSSGEVIQAGDLILCEMPAQSFKKMADYYRDKRHRQVDNVVASHIASANQTDNTEKGFGPITMTRTGKVTTRQPIVASDRD